MSELTFDYKCRDCGNPTNSNEMTSFVCECGGDFRLSNSLSGHVFHDYYSPEMKEHISSSKQEKKSWKKNGVVPIGDCKAMMERARTTRKHKEEIIKERYAKEGLKYTPGKNLRYNEATHSFIPAHQR